MGVSVSGYGVSGSFGGTGSTYRCLADLAMPLLRTLSSWYQMNPTSSPPLLYHVSLTLYLLMSPTHPPTHTSEESLKREAEVGGPASCWKPQVLWRRCRGSPLKNAWRRHLFFEDKGRNPLHCCVRVRVMHHHCSVLQVQRTEPSYLSLPLNQRYLAVKRVPLGLT